MSLALPQRLAMPSRFTHRATPGFPVTESPPTTRSLPAISKGFFCDRNSSPQNQESRDLKGEEMKPPLTSIADSDLLCVLSIRHLLSGQFVKVSLYKAANIAGGRLCPDITIRGCSQAGSGTNTGNKAETRCNCESYRCADGSFQPCRSRWH